MFTYNMSLSSVGLIRGKHLLNCMHMFLVLLGVFTVSGIIDAFVYHGHRAIKKMEIGKNM